MTRADATGALAGRILLSLIFVMSGLHKVFAFEQTQAYMASQGMPATGFFAVAAIAVEVIAGLCLLFGYFGRSAAAVLAAYLVPVTLIFHGFWALTGAEQQQQMIAFMKNLAIMGGLVYVASLGSRAFSLDAKLRAGTERPRSERELESAGAHHHPSRA